MAFHKKEFYPLQSQILSDQTVGINYPSRSKILIDLLSGPKTSFELADNQVISRPTLREHLNKLLQMDFIVVDKHQKQPTYRIQLSAIPQWVFIALLDHPEVEIQNLFPHLSIPFLSKTLAEATAFNEAPTKMSNSIKHSDETFN